MPPHFGYVRVSTYEQNPDRQLAEMDLAQVEEIFTDYASAKDTKRPALRDCIKHLRKGDTLHIHSIDRLARNLLDLQLLITGFTDKGITVNFHKEKLIFTADENSLQKLQLQIMGAFAEFERSLIRERQREGIAAAKAAGKHLGRPALLTDEQETAIKNKKAEGTNPSQLAREYGVSRATIYKAISNKP